MDGNSLYLVQEIMGPLTGIIFFITMGLVIATYLYFRSRERQMIIEKGLSPEQINETFRSKKNPYIWLKLGIIIIGAGIGIGLGVIFNHADVNVGFIPLSIITFIGIGFVAAFFVSRKYEKEDEKERIN